MFEIVLAVVALGAVVSLYFVIGYLRRSEAAPLEALWLQFEDCRVDADSGVVTASGTLDYGGSMKHFDEFVKQWSPPFDIRISANGEDMEMVVVSLHVKVGSPRVRWDAQDKKSYIAAHFVAGYRQAEQRHGHRD